MEGILNGWKVDKCIGEGAFGKVYQISREDFGHTYYSALKVIQIPQHQSEIDSARNEGMTEENVTEYFYGMVEDIVEEFVLMSKLKGNSNIVSYEDHFVEKRKEKFGWNIYIRMELLTPLYQHIKKTKMTVRDIIQLGIDMCHALEICQRYNIIHRDIKPENIFVSDVGTYKLGDFGIARELEKTSSGLSKKGTKSYMAPEVYKGLEYNSTVDVYSLGIVLYRFLNNNRLPFLPAAPLPIKYSDKEKADIMRMSGQALPKPCNVEGRLAEIVLKACEYNPRERYESARDMRKALEEIMYSEVEKEFAYPNGDELENNRAEYILETGKESNVDESIEENEGTRYLFSNEEENATKKESEKKELEKEKLEKKETDIEKKESKSNPEILKEERKESYKKEILQEKKTPIVNRKKYLLVVAVAVLAVFAGVVVWGKIKGRQKSQDSVANINITQTPDVTEVATETETPSPTTPPSYQLESVVGEEKSVAIQKLKEQTGIEAVVEEVYSSSVEKGKVISQNPEAGGVYYQTNDTQQYAVLNTVSITVSKGVKMVTVPDLEGKTVTRAKEILKKKGLKVAVNSSVYSSKIRSGRIVYQSVNGGKKVKEGKTIHITPSKGKEPVFSTENSNSTYKSSTQKPAVTSKPKTMRKPAVTSKPKATRKPAKDDAEWSNAGDDAVLLD